MLQLLKSATESYLDVKVTTAFVVGPGMPFPAFQKLFHVAASDINLDPPVLLNVPATSFAAMANRIGEICYRYPPIPQGEDDQRPSQLMLQLEYRRAGLTAVLFYEQCSFAKPLREAQDPHPGPRRMVERHA